MSAIPSIFHPSSPEARSIYQLMMGILILCSVIFVLVVGLVSYACFKYRATPSSREPEPVHGNTWLERTWTIIPFLILVVVMVFGVKTMVAVSPFGTSGRADMTVIGHQWWWEVRYPLNDGSEAITANEIHIPIRKRMLLNILAADVIHDFWVPELGRKIDAIPGQINQIWLRADEKDTFLGFCAEFCGTSHSWMQIRVMADNESEFKSWLNHLTGAAQYPQSPAEKRGLNIFRSYTCMNCHQIKGITQAVQIGPDLTHLGSRETLAAGALLNNSSDLTRWLLNPGQIKPGAHMPSFGLRKNELKDLVAFLGSLK